MFCVCQVSIYYGYICIVLVQHVCFQSTFILTHCPLHAGLFELAFSQLYCVRGLFGVE